MFILISWYWGEIERNWILVNVGKFLGINILLEKFFIFVLLFMLVMIFCKFLFKSMLWVNKNGVKFYFFYGI